MKFRNGLKKIAIVGAFDRHNYGDLLFPIIITMAAKIRGFNGEVECFSTRVSDLTKFGAIQTKSLRSLFASKNGTDTLVIVGGGEVLSATWPVIVRYLCPQRLGSLISRLTRLLGFQVSANILSKLMGVPTALPFVYSNDDFPAGALVAYNAVGGSHLANDEDNAVRNAVAAKLKDVSYISVRDDKTKRILEKLNVKPVHLAPDCAVLLSDLFEIHELSQRVSGELRGLCADFKNGYICFQSALTYVVGREKAIAQMLNKLQAVTGLGVVIFVIGRAPGHCDHDAASLVKQHLSEDRQIKLFASDTIFEVMYLIAMSKAYAGTSLHGVITALSYAVPHIGLCPREVPKLAEFVNSWCDSDTSGLSEYSDLIQHVIRVTAAPRCGLTEVSENLKLRSNANFDDMFLIADTKSCLPM